MVAFVVLVMGEARVLEMVGRWCSAEVEGDTKVALARKE
jgi:hypothetical protein